MFLREMANNKKTQTTKYNLRTRNPNVNIVISPVVEKKPEMQEIFEAEVTKEMNFI